MCNRLKDRVHPLDQSQVVYRVECSSHNVSYVGETDRSLRERAYDHGIITHEESRHAHSITQNKPQPAAAAEIGVQPLRRSTRMTQRHDYKAMNDGSDQVWSTGSTAVSEHKAKLDHKSGDMTIKKIGSERSWKRRVIKEAIEIKRHQPQINKDANDTGKHYISNIYNCIINASARTITSSDVLEPPAQDEDGNLRERSPNNHSDDDDLEDVEN